MAVNPKVGVGDFTFSMHRKEIIFKLGNPDLILINERVYPGVIIDEYRKHGLSFFYDFRVDLQPFCIETAKRSKATLLGDSYFDKTFEYLKTDFFEKNDLTCVFFWNNHIRVEELSVEFDYYGLNLDDNTKVRALRVFREGTENLLWERSREPSPKPLSSEERAEKYARFYSIS